MGNRLVNRLPRGKLHPRAKNSLRPASLYTAVSISVHLGLCGGQQRRDRPRGRGAQLAIPRLGGAALVQVVRGAATLRPLVHLPRAQLHLVRVRGRVRVRVRV